jgi:hypothetical protein
MDETKALTTAVDAATIEQVVIGGDLSKLAAAQRVAYYKSVCESIGLNPLTRPFDYITLNGKLTLYAKKDATDQLRRIHGISMGKPDITFQDDLIVVAISARNKDGREDSDVGIVKKSDMRGDVANATMKAVTKAKRRVTLSLCGLGWLDETEVETIADAAPVIVTETGEIVEGAKMNGSPRPYSPEVLAQRVGERAATHKDKSASPAQRGLATGMLELCFAGDAASDAKRHTVLKHLFDVTSMNDITDAQVLAILDWLKPSKDSGGAYSVDPVSAREAQAVVTAAMKAAGQGELL